MSYQVDILAVGDNSKSGDAIALRFGDLEDRTRHMVVVIDGGFLECGEEMVKHIRNHYETERVDLVVSTHPDNDHVSGLRPIVEQLEIGVLAMHRPWRGAESAANTLRSARSRSAASWTKLERSLSTASELEDIAIRRSIKIVEPYAGVGTGDGAILVLGPDESYYWALAKEFDGARAHGGFTAMVSRGVQTLLARVKETWDKDTLVEPTEDAVSPMNNSSVILLARFDQASFLFTADAGVPALTRALDYAATRSIEVGGFTHVQVPHHGSKRNVGPAVLTRLFGPITAEGARTGRRAFISAAKDGAPKHPSKRVTNAVIRRGAAAFVTAGAGHCHWSLDAQRPGWSALTPLSFCSEHDEDDE